MDDAVDRSFGIRDENGHFMMGDKILKIYDDDDIMLDDEVYVGTSGTPEGLGVVSTRIDFSMCI